MAVFLLTAATPGTHSPLAHTPSHRDARLLPNRNDAPKARAAATLTRDDSKDLKRTR